MTASIQRGSTETSISVNQLPATATKVAFSSYSRFVQRLRRRYAAELVLLAPGEPRRESMALAFDALRQRGDSVGDALRIVRQLVMERLVTLDCDAQAPLAVVTTAVTELAEFALDVACRDACQALDAVHGAPLGPEGQRAQLWVIGMGKLGARELNVSSDIDLIYIYDQDGDTTGRPPRAGAGISNQEYFLRKMVKAHLCAGGRHHRARLCVPRGPGAAAQRQLGPARRVARCALEEYFHVQGREWERFAWLKSRVVAPQQAIVFAGCAQQLRGVVVPFVFRRYLDYNVFDSLRGLHRQIRDHASASRSAGRPERSQRCEAVARRYPRDRIHRAAAAGGARRPVPRAAHPPHR